MIIIVQVPHVETVITRIVLDLRGELYRPSTHYGMLLRHFAGRPTFTGSQDGTK